MVYFKDKSSPSGEHHLIILDDQHQPMEKGTILVVYAALVGGRNLSPWPRLTNSFYLDEWTQEVSLSKNVKAWTLRATHHELPRRQQSNDFAPLRTLGRSIIEGDAKWDGDLQFIGEFHYTKGYWEWTEDVLSQCGKRLRLISAYDIVYASLFTYDHNSDIIKAFCEAWCPLTNTLLTSAGELSISLWDLHDLAGLPIAGYFYYEVVPSADDDQCSNVSIDKWVKFWSKKAIKYHLDGQIAKEALFEKLCIEGNLKEEVYLAVYLACWLCTFILPGKDVNSIRPSTFKMASMMASGRRVSLAIPVLASIYEETYKTWWAKVHGTFLHDNIACLINPKPTKITIKRKKHEDEQLDGGENNLSHVLVPSTVVKSNSQALAVELENEIQSIDASEESETSHSWTMNPPFGMGLKGKQLPQPPAVSVLEGESFLFSHHKEFLQKMWSDLLVKISNTPVDFLSSIEDDVYLVLESMKRFRKFDLRSLHEQHLKEARVRLQDVQAKASEGASEVQSIVDELEHVEKEIVALKGLRTSLCAALKEQKQPNHDAQGKVHEVEGDIATLDNTAPFDDAIVEDSKANLEILKEDLKSLKPFA
ncbi:UNVERIFIED_CONTAM: hypothetical protein Slati_1150700 [Sesamum latifolium]|uniref:Aminotransferase-like plant mobile domain-containing protein n=1 Tax=Sesamum latifolium TaxID=2727402 RepID=A0AAW2XFQ8_9LAMI